MRPAAGLALMVSAIGALLPVTLIAPLLQEEPTSAVLWLFLLVTLFPYLVAAGIAWVCRADARSAGIALIVSELVVLLGWGGWLVGGWLGPAFLFVFGSWLIPALQLVTVLGAGIVANRRVSG